MSTEIDELKQARYRSGKTISGHNAFLRPPTGETNSVDTRGFYFVLKEPHPNFFASPGSPLLSFPFAMGFRSYFVRSCWICSSKAAAVCRFSFFRTVHVASSATHAALFAAI